MRDALGEDLVKLGIRLLRKALDYGPLARDPEWFNDDENFAYCMQQTLYLGLARANFWFSVTSRVKTKLLYGTHRLARPRSSDDRQRALSSRTARTAADRTTALLLSRTSAGNVREKAPTHVSCAITLCKLRQTLTAWGPAPPGLGLAPPAGFAPALAPGFGAKPLTPPICWTSFLF